MNWWYCLIHKVVEEGSACPNASRLGPYESREVAEQAMSRISARNKELDEQDQED